MPGGKEQTGRCWRWVKLVSDFLVWTLSCLDVCSAGLSLRIHETVLHAHDADVSLKEESRVLPASLGLLGQVHGLRAKCYGFS